MCLGGVTRVLDFKTVDDIFRDIQNYQGRDKCYQPKAKPESDNTQQDLNNSGYHENPNPIIILLHILLQRI